MLMSERDITLRGSSTWSGRVGATTMSEYRKTVAVLYIDELISNINSRFSDIAVKLLVYSSIFNPASIPSEERLSSVGKK